MSLEASSPENPNAPLASTGVPGLDTILGGGLPRDRVYLIQGSPGTGKTTLALQFLFEGVARQERVVYVTLSESREEIEAVASSHHWSLEGMTVLEMLPAERLTPDEQYTLFHPAEVEFGQVLQPLLDKLEAIRPTRVVFDSLSEMRLLARDPLRYRRHILSLKQFFAGRSSTVVILDDQTDGSEYLQSVMHGVVELESVPVPYGAERRRLRVVKLRGVAYLGGYHDLVIRTGGLAIYPRLVAAQTRHLFITQPVASGLPELDSMLGGGLDQGTSTLILGPAGAGKTVLAMVYCHAALERGEAAAIFTFDENPSILLQRSRGLNIDLTAYHASGQLRLEQVDPAELSPGEFVHRVCSATSRQGARVVAIDSLNGYMHAMPEERFLIPQLHELLTYLGQHQVLTFLVSAQHGMVGSSVQSPVEVTYLADSVLLLRFFEHRGQICQALSVLKKRSGNHERTIREFRLEPGRISVGQPLREFRGVLTGVPEAEKKSGNGGAAAGGDGGGRNDDGQSGARTRDKSRAKSPALDAPGQG